MSHQTLGLAEQDVPGGTVLRIVTTGWDIGLRVNRGPEGQIDSAFVERIAHDDDPRRAALLAARLELSRDGERVVLLHQSHVVNAP